jgi:site-specific recombinase XerD
MINAYIESKRLAWAPSTLRSEKHRLSAFADAMDGTPLTLWNNIEYMKPYSRLTAWTRATEYWQFLIDGGHRNGPNPYKQFRETNARLFRNCYVTKTPVITFAQATHSIQTGLTGPYRQMALQLLHTGMRISERRSLKEGTVVGKGNKRRAVFLHTSEAGETCNESTFRRHLSKIGLKPHDLRKLFLTRMVERGASPYELCQLAGWSSINTAASYIQVNQNRLKELTNL